MVMTWCGVKELPGATDCWVTVPAGWVLFASATSFSETLLACAHCSATAFCCPTKLGTGCPVLTTSDTGRLCGQDTPAAGEVLMTIPLWMVVDVWLTTLPGIRPACRSEASAVARVFPVTWGTGIMCGPAETMSSTVPPLLTRDPMAGLVPMTLPLATRALNWALPIFTVRPSLRISSRAVLAVRPPTCGTVVYLPADCHQTSRPTRSTTARPPST